MAGNVACSVPAPDRLLLWMCRWMSAAISAPKNTHSEPMKASMPAPMKLKRRPVMSSAIGSLQRAVIQTASTMSRNSTPSKRHDQGAEQADRP